MLVTFEKMEKSVVPRKEKVSNKHIPDDLVFTILSKLPVKSVKRFGCVCKSWGGLLEIENTDFLNMFRNNFISNDHSCHYHTYLLPKQPWPNQHYSSLYLLSGEKFENKIKLDWPPPFQEDDRYIYVSGSVVDGMFCLYQGDTRIVLWNPSTEEFKIIPHSHSAADSPPPDLSPLVFVKGFGYDHLRDDYKVIRHVVFFPVTDYEYDEEHLPSSDHPFWEIYSLRSDSWRKLDVDFEVDANLGVHNHLYLNGMCHWRAHDYSSESVVSFDLSNEVFLTTPIPSVVEDSPSDMDDNLDECELVWRQMVELNQSIALVSNYEKTNTFHVSILGELGVKESWVKLFIIGPFPCLLYVIGSRKNGDIFFIKDNELVWCDLSTQRIEELGIKGDTSTQIGHYKESLLPIRRINN